MPNLQDRPEKQHDHSGDIDQSLAPLALGLCPDRNLNDCNDDKSAEPPVDQSGDVLGGGVQVRRGSHFVAFGKKVLDFIRIAFSEAMQSRLIVAQVAFALGVFIGGQAVISAVTEAIDQLPISSLCDNAPAASGN